MQVTENNSPNDYPLALGAAPNPLPQGKANPRVKSSLRLKYEAEAQVLRTKLGGLEAIRAQLGLSQRKMCQLLLVDPSAWTRWTQGGEAAPPHVYRMLQWYLALNEKYPAMDASFWLSTVSRETFESDQEKIARLNETLNKKMQQLNGELTAIRSELIGANRLVSLLNLKFLRLRLFSAIGFGLLLLTIALHFFAPTK